MFTSILVTILVAELVKPPKQPDLGFVWREIELRGSNEMLIRPEMFREPSRWVRLFGIDTPKANERGYSGAVQDLEILLGNRADVHFENEDPRHPISRNVTLVQYIWTRGTLIQFELLRDGWATVNEEGRKGKYGKFLVAAEAEAKRFHEGMWALRS